MVEKVQYTFPEGDEEVQFNYISDMMDAVEESTYNDLVLKIDTNYKNEWFLEIYEYAEEDDRETFDSLELVDWYNGQTLKDVFDFLVERYL